MSASGGNTAKQLQTGKTGKDAPAKDPFWDPFIKSASVAFQMTEEDLREDLEKERDEAIQSKDGYKDFKPFVLYADEAFKRICSAFNYDPKAAEGSYQFDFHPADLVEAITILAEAMSKKKFGFIDKVFRGLQKRCDKLFNIPQKNEDTDEAREERRQRVVAYLTLFLCVLKFFVVRDKFVRAYRDSSAKPDLPETESQKEAAKDIRDKVEKGEAIKFLFEWVADFVEAVATLVWNKPDRRRMKDWAEQFKAGQERVEGSRKDLDAAWKNAGFDRKPKAGGKPAPDPGMKEGTIEKWVSTLKGIGELIGTAIDAFGAFEEMRPKEIDGAWNVQNFPDGQVLWSLEIEQDSKNAFSGKLKGHGRAHPEDRRIRVADWVDEEKASLEIHRDPASPKVLHFRWKPAKSKQKKFPAIGDGFFYGSRELEEDFEFFSTTRLGCPASAMGQRPGEKKAVELTRSPTDLKHCFAFFVAVLKCVGAIWSLVPEAQRNKILAKVLEKAAGPLKKINAKIPESLRERVNITISSDKKGEADVWMLNLEMAPQKNRIDLSASWEILPLLEAAVDLFAKEKPKGDKKSALLPYKLALKVAYREWGEISVGLSYWDGAANDKKAGEKLDRLIQFFCGLDARQSFDKWFQGKGLHPDVNKPRIRMGSVGKVEKGDVGEMLPAVELPIDLYIEDLLNFGEPAGPAGGSLPAQLTLTFGLTAAAVASKIPQIRAVLFAWDVGWTIGSFINELPPVQRASDRATSWLADWATYKDIDDRFDRLWDGVYRLSTSGAIATMELTIVTVKGPLFVAEEWARNHGFQMLFRDGRHPSFDRWAEERGRREAEARARLQDSRDPSRYCWSAGHAMLMAYAMGSDAWTPDQISTQLDQDYGDHLLHPMQKDLLAFYLMPFDDVTFEADYRKLSDQFVGRYQGDYQGAVTSLQKAADEKRALDAADVVITRWYELVARPEHRDLVACMLYQAKEPEKKDEIQVFKAPDGYRWEALRARANENLEIKFTDINAGFVLHSVQVDRRRDALLARCQFHHATGLFSPFADQLKIARAPARIGGRDCIGTHLLIEVRGHGESQRAMWFLEVDDRGLVLDAVEAN